MILFLAELTAERLPGTREEDPMRLYLQCMEDHMLMHMQVGGGGNYCGRGRCSVWGGRVTLM